MWPGRGGRRTEEKRNVASQRGKGTTKRVRERRKRHNRDRGRERERWVGLGVRKGQGEESRLKRKEGCMMKREKLGKSVFFFDVFCPATPVEH